MNTFEFQKGLQKIKIADIRTMAIEAVQEYESEVLSDSIDANLKGLTFDAQQISDDEPLTDWDETGLFHANLRFNDDKNIDFYSSGKGADFLFQNVADVKISAPSAKTLSSFTMQKIKQSFIYILKDKIK